MQKTNSTKGRSEKWRDWRRHIAGRCDILTREMSPPIPLQEIYSRCKVKKVVFQPMLVEAGLAIDDDGFVVFVSCDEEAKQEWTSAFNDANQRGRFLPGRVRFSMAHELIHTFFYDTEQKPYRKKIRETHHKEIDSLETACNYGASQLLLPTRQLRTDTNKSDFLSTRRIVDLARKYRVSIECLIHRLEYLEDWTAERGILVYLKEVNDEYRIRAIAKSASVRGLFENAINDSDYKSLFDKAVFEQMKLHRSGNLEYELTYNNGSDTSGVMCRLEYSQVVTTQNAFVVALGVTDMQKTHIRQVRKEYPDKDYFVKLKDMIK